VFRNFTQSFGIKAKRARLLAALLLTILGWQSSAEFTHKHGSLPRATKSSQQQITAVPQPTEDAHSHKRSGSASFFRTATDCLICQLHQNLSTTVFTDTSVSSATQARVLAIEHTAAFVRADFSGNQRGRAPPTIL